jgi:Zn-dependent M28 family amino/carboxypeptidase
LGIEARVEISFSSLERGQTANVLGLLPGSDPDLAHEVIVLGAHYDHVGDDPPGEQGGGLRYPGANDDASGVAVLLEIARLWQAAGYQPGRSVLFAAWGAQEPGELGSRYYVDHPLLPLKDTVAMLQLDTVGGGEGYYLEAQGGSAREGLLLFNLQVADEWVDGRLTLESQWAQSDQIPFHEAGVPSLLITWREASEDNWPVEIADEVDPYRLGVTGRMVTLAVMATAR